jgi:putative membrane protein
MLLRRLAIVASVFPFCASAHVGEPLEPHDLLTGQALVLDPLIVASLLLAAVLYWRGNTKEHGIRTWEARSYWAGWVLLAVALVSPLHAMGEVLFSAHMAQHELMMLAAAPLLVLGRPLVPYVWALPERWRRPVARPICARPVQTLWRTISHPLHACWIHGAALWIWHTPQLYQASVSSDLVHTIQHLSFLLTALLFWWALLRNPRTRGQYGLAVIYVFSTALHTSVLGALLTFAPTVWYPVYAQTTWAWGFTALEDQQVGGLIMWVPAGLLYTIAGLALIAAWLRESETRVSAAGIVRTAWIVAVATGAAAASSCTAGQHAAAASEMTGGGNPKRGPALIQYYGCGSCHDIPGVRGADGLVGPPLQRVALRSYLAGKLPNSPANMIHWIREPREVDLETVMPNMNVTEKDARDIAAYLYTLQ